MKENMKTNDQVNRAEADASTPRNADAAKDVITPTTEDGGSGSTFCSLLGDSTVTAHPRDIVTIPDNLTGVVTINGDKEPRKYEFENGKLKSVSIVFGKNN